MSPVTVFVLMPLKLTWLGIVIFLVLIISAIEISWCIRGKGTTGKDWFRKVFLYGASELADEIVKRHNELREEGDPAPWWGGFFVFWWGFSVKYLIPYVLTMLMMWNFKGDLTLDELTGRGYGNYHAFWQIMGFVYPAIGLILFIVPIFVFCGTKQEDINFDEEEGLVHNEIEMAHKATLAAQQGKTGSVHSKGKVMPDPEAAAETKVVDFEGPIET